MPSSRKNIRPTLSTVPTRLGALVLGLCTLACPAVHANGLRLETSVIVVEAQDGEGVIAVKNTDSKAVLLHSEVVNVPEDTSPLLLVTPPITRVDAGNTQMVRFLLKPNQTLTTERLKRATFEGIPQTAPNKVQVNIRQNIPVIIRPAGLARNGQPWKLLQWTHTADGIAVRNTGPYVVRMSQELTLQPGEIPAKLPRTYILPGESVALSSSSDLRAARGVRYTPATLNGYFADPVDADVQAGPPRVDLAPAAQ
ncbi:fimbrial chaperone protein [Stenotrophomonas sp. SAU14A_NAIMI4_8]|nr:fimbrial chaperone protein [Stenotrophomonas sp. SAU14A_NAIMI4_8]